MRSAHAAAAAGGMFSTSNSSTETPDFRFLPGVFFLGTLLANLFSKQNVIKRKSKIENVRHSKTISTNNNWNNSHCGIWFSKYVPVGFVGQGGSLTLGSTRRAQHTTGTWKQNIQKWKIIIKCEYQMENTNCVDKRTRVDKYLIETKLII